MMVFFFTCIGAQMAGFYGRGGPSPSMQTPYGRGAATGDAPQPQPQPAIPPPSTSQPSVPSGEHPSPPQAEPSGPQVHCSIPVASIFRCCLNKTISLLLIQSGIFNNKYCHLLNITGPSRADVQSESIRSGKHS